MSLFTPLKSEQSGFLLILTLVQGLVFITILTGVMTLGLYNLGAAKRSTYITSATYAAEAGADRFMYEINEDTDYTGTNTVCPIGTSGSNPVTLYNNASGRATYETCVTNGTIDDEKIVYAVGKVYVPAGSAVPKATRTVRLIITGTPGGEFTVMSGPGGLVLDNNAVINNGPVYVGGFLTMDNNTRIGSATAPVSVYVANQRCPVPINSTWPQICPTGTLNNPITIDNNARIYGDVHANGQTNNARMSHPGLVQTSDVDPILMPDIDRDAMKATINGSANALTGANASCGNNGNKTWPADVKISGNVTIGNNCNLTITGNVWITGNITFSNNGKLIVGSAVSTQPFIMIDGAGGIMFSNNNSINANASGIAPKIITFYSTASCGADCDNVTGSDLNASMNVTTINLDNNINVANSTLIARWTALNLDNNITVGAVMAQKITVGNNTMLTFGDSLTGAGKYTWNVRYYETL